MPATPSDTKLFPLQALDASTRQTLTIPFAYAEAAYLEYVEQYGSGQSLERIAQRGGFGVQEILQLLCRRLERLGGLPPRAITRERAQEVRKSYEDRWLDGPGAGPAEQKAPNV